MLSYKFEVIDKKHQCHITLRSRIFTSSKQLNLHTEEKWGRTDQAFTHSTSKPSFIILLKGNIVTQEKKSLSSTILCTNTKTIHHVHFSRYKYFNNVSNTFSQSYEPVITKARFSKK